MIKYSIQYFFYSEKWSDFQTPYIMNRVIITSKVWLVTSRLTKRMMKGVQRFYS